MNATIKKRISWKNRSKVFEKACREYGKSVPVFNLPGNHDYYAGGTGFFYLLDTTGQINGLFRLWSGPPGRQRGANPLSLPVYGSRSVLAVKGSLRRAQDAPLTAPGRPEAVN